MVLCSMLLLVLCNTQTSIQNVCRLPQEILSCPSCCFHCSVQSCFQSDYLSLVDAAGTAMGELLCSKQALAEVRLKISRRHHGC